MKKWKGIVAIALAALTLLALAAPALAASLIGTAKAKEIALETAGVTASEARGFRTRLTRDDGRRVYDVEFRANGVEHEFEIDAETGAVREYDRDGARQTGASATNPGNDTGTDAAKPGANTSTITLEKAKAIALEHAGVEESDATFVRGHLDYDDGRQVYEVEFYAGNLEYDYEIDASTGRIRDYDRDAEYYKPSSKPSTGSKPSSGSKPSTGTSGSITLEEAKSIALKHAGLSASEVRFTKAKKDRDDGRQVYDIEFRKGRTEYEYEIDASTGKIRDYDRDYDD